MKEPDNSEIISPEEQTLVRNRSFPRWGAFLIWAGLLTLFILLGFGLYLKSLNQVQNGAAPDFELTSFDGQKVRLSALGGQVVVINFWASWCIPCRDEAPILEATWREYRDKGVVFIGVDYLDPEDNARAYIKEFNITYPNGPDLQERISSAYRIKRVPETFFVARQGKIQGLFIGPLNQAELQQRIKNLLAQP